MDQLKNGSIEKSTSWPQFSVPGLLERSKTELDGKKVFYQIDRLFLVQTVHLGHVLKKNTDCRLQAGDDFLQVKLLFYKLVWAS